MSDGILFNSHALNSLKRTQLIKLCKRYGIKATGKTPELIVKLEAYAQTLPPASTFVCPSEADLLSSPSKQTFVDESDSDTEETIPVHSASGRTRPSDQWEGVSEVDDIFAADGTIRREHGILAPHTNGTVGSSRSGKSGEEFGSGSQDGGKVGSSSSKSSITSSLKSIASAFVRSSKHAPEPRQPTPPLLAPVPRRHATPPPVQGSGPHTVRLIASPSPFPRSRSAADLLPGVPLPTPSFDKLTADLAQADAILASGGVESSPGPRISFGFGSAGYDDEDVSMATITRPVASAAFNHEEASSEEDDVPGGLPAAAASKPPAVAADPESLASPTTPFVFGSPRYSVSNTQFGDAAAAVLREMNARMGVTGSSQVVSLEQLEGVLSNKTTGAGSSVDAEKKADIRFTNYHEKEFAKMDSIANHYSITASRANKRKSQHEPSSSTEPNPNKIFTLPPHIVAPPTLPERTTKRARMSTVDGEEPAEPSTSTTQEKVIHDSPVVRANLERKRRSSAARASLAGRKSAGAARKSTSRQPAPPPTSRFGFVGRIVSRVWGGGSKKEKDEEKGKGKEKEKPVPSAPAQTERKPSVNVAKKFPSVPTEEPVHVPNFPAAPKTKPVSSAGLGLGRPSSVVPKAGYVRPSTTAKIGTVKPSVEAARKSTGVTRGSSELGASGAQSRPGSVAGQLRTGSTTTASASTRTRPTSTLLAPTAASMARQGSVASKTAAAPKPSAIPVAKLAATTKPAGRPLPVPPTNVGRAATSGAAVAGSARMASPPVRASSVMSSGRGALSPSAGVRSPTTTARKSTAAQAVGRQSSVRSPNAATGAKPRASIFKTQLTVDAMTMRAAAPTIQPFRLSPQVNIPTTSAPPVASPKPAAAATSPRPVLKPTATAAAGTTGLRTQRRPRISRSKVIAKLEEKRAAAASANKPAALSPVSKARSSAHLRRSLGGVAARKALDADMERRARVRKSEAARRKSKVGPSLKRRSEGAVLRTNRQEDVEMDD